MAVVLGWRVVRCTPPQLATPETIEMMQRLLGPARMAPAHG
jgi:hypothetical protein